MQVKSSEIISLILWISSLIFVGFLLSMTTGASIKTWYILLEKSPLTPPNHYFGIAWTLLYAMIGTSGWLIWRSVPDANLNFIKKLFIIQLLLNWSWTPLFFGLHLIGTSLITISTLAIVIICIIKTSLSKHAKVSLLLTPYLLWVIFATYLNLYIWLYN